MNSKFYEIQSDILLEYFSQCGNYRCGHITLFLWVSGFKRNWSFRCCLCKFEMNPFCCNWPVLECIHTCSMFLFCCIANFHWLTQLNYNIHKDIGSVQGQVMDNKSRLHIESAQVLKHKIGWNIWNEFLKTYHCQVFHICAVIYKIFPEGASSIGFHNVFIEVMFTMACSSCPFSAL